MGDIHDLFDDPDEPSWKHQEKAAKKKDQINRIVERLLDGGVLKNPENLKVSVWRVNEVRKVLEEIL